MKDIVIDRERVYAALPPLITALVYGTALAFSGSYLGMWGEDLCVLLQVEFLVIHSFPFLCIFAWMRNVQAAKLELEGKGRKPRFLSLVFLGFLGLYAAGSLTLGWIGPFYFLAATAATYLGFWFRRMEADALAQLGIRWLVSFIIYLVCISLFDLSNSVNNWSAEPRTYRAGFAYFLILAGFEVSGIYSKIGPKLKKMWMAGYVGPRMPGPGSPS